MHCSSSSSSNDDDDDDELYVAIGMQHLLLRVRNVYHRRIPAKYRASH